MPKNDLNVTLKGIDELLFSTEEQRQEEKREQVQQIPIDELHPFTNHPFKVVDDDAMTRTVESIAQFGVLAPLIARPRPDGDGYEIISRHNHYVRDGFGKLRISKIKYSDIKKFYYSLILEKGFKPNSMEIVHTLLHPTFTMAVRDGLLRLNPTEGVMAEIKKSHCWEKTKRHALTVAEQRAFTNYIANSEEYRGWFPLFTVMLGTGCRIGEVLGLRWQDVDFKNRTISINHNLVYRVQEDGTCTNHVNSPKTKAGIRIIPMIDEVFDAFLEEYQYQKVIGFCTDEIDGYSGFVFCTGDGKVYLPNAINRTIRSICADYNKEEESKAKEENRDPVLLPKFSCHILRHTFCTRFCENETNLKVIQEIMGHADISTTMDVYAEATQEKKKESMTSLQSALLVR